MGNNSIKSSNKKFSKPTKTKNLLCCLCTSSFSLDDKSLPTFDRIASNIDKNRLNQKQICYSPPSKDLEKSLHGPSIELLIKSNREFVNLINKFQLTFYLKDYLNRLQNSKINQTFPTHFSSSTIIYPCNGVNQFLTDDLNLFLITPPESILPNLLINSNHSYKIHEQIRSKCYFIPLTNSQIEPDDDEYKQKSIPLDRSHVVITLETNPTIKTNNTSVEVESTCIFISNDSFQTGFICIDQEKIAKQFLPFIYYYLEENLFYLSSNLIQKWFNTLILVNQTCAIAKRFLIGDKNHITCLLKEQITNQENSFSFGNNLIFAALRLPPCIYINEPSSTDFCEEKPEKIIDAFSPTFLSDNKKISNDSIHLDYEQYSFAFLLSRWPKVLIENYYTHPHRYSTRKWPSKFHMNIIIKKSLLLVPDSNIHQWKLNFDLIEEYLFELMNESTLFFYILCQQLFSSTYEIRILIKHCFLNYCEKYGLPFSNNRNNILDLITHFLKDLSKQINKKFLPNYFNHQINLLNTNENYNQWFNYINQCLTNRIYFSSSPSSLLTTLSNRSLIIEFLFSFIDQLYQRFHLNRSEFHLNDNLLLNLHKQLCEKLTNQNLFIEKLMNNQQIIENIQMNLTFHFETNAELVHICLNQIRKAQTSLIFHYTWTIFIQYLHTYYNVLWNM